MERGQGGGCFIPYQDCTFRKKPWRAERGCGAQRKQVWGPVTPRLRDPLPSRGHHPPAHRGTDQPGGSAPAPRAQTSAGSPELPGVTGAWRFFKTRSNFLFEAVDKSAQKLDNPSRFREIPLLRLTAPLQYPFSPPNIRGGRVEHSSLSHFQVASGLGQTPCPSVRSVASARSGHVPGRCPSPEGGPSPTAPS